MTEQLKLQLVPKERVSTGGLEKLFSDTAETRSNSLDTVETRNPLRNDFNFSRLPYFVASDRKADRYRNIWLELEAVNVLDKETGQTIKATWEVQHSSRLGLPGGFDRDVWLGILEIIDAETQHGKLPCPKAIELGPARHFLRRIGKSGGGAEIRRLQDSIERLAQTTCTSKGAYNCPNLGGYIVGESFKLVDGWGFYGEDDGKGGVHETNFVKISEFVRSNLSADGYITFVDAPYLRSLNGEIAKQLYQLLSYQFWKSAKRGQATCVLPWQHVPNYLGVSGWTTLWRAKQRLQPAIDELIKHEYIESTCWSGNNLELRPGVRYIQEHARRITAKAQYQQWVQGAGHEKGKAAGTLVTARTAITEHDERVTKLTIQATKVILGQTADMDKLAALGWTDADLLAAVEKQRQIMNR